MGPKTRRLQVTCLCLQHLQHPGNARYRRLQVPCLRLSESIASREWDKQEDAGHVSLALRIYSIQGMGGTRLFVTRGCRSRFYIPKSTTRGMGPKGGGCRSRVFVFQHLQHPGKGAQDRRLQVTCLRLSVQGYGRNFHGNRQPLFILRVQLHHLPKPRPRVSALPDEAKKHIEAT